MWLAKILIKLITLVRIRRSYPVNHFILRLKYNPFNPQPPWLSIEDFHVIGTIVWIPPVIGFGSPLAFGWTPGDGHGERERERERVWMCFN